MERSLTAKQLRLLEALREFKKSNDYLKLIGIVSGVTRPEGLAWEQIKEVVDIFHGE